jgi:hypothetical protein
VECSPSGRETEDAAPVSAPNPFPSVLAAASSVRLIACLAVACLAVAYLAVACLAVACPLLPCLSGCQPVPVQHQWSNVPTRQRTRNSIKGQPRLVQRAQGSTG